MALYEDLKICSHHILLALLHSFHNCYVLLIQPVIILFGRGAYYCIEADWAKNPVTMVRFKNAGASHAAGISPQKFWLCPV